MVLEFRKLNNLDLPGRTQTQLSEIYDADSQKNDHKMIDLNLILNSPLSGISNNNDKVDSLFKKPQSQKVYPELVINYLNQESLKSSIHQSQN